MSAPAPAGRPRIAFFGAFRLDPVSGELRREGGVQRLPEKPLKALVALLNRPGRLVTRNELFDCLWPEGVHVDFDANLNAAMVKVREALGDAAQSPRFVETVPRRGYRFIAPVRWEHESDGAPRAAWPGIRRMRRVPAVGATIAACVALVVAAVWFSSAGPEPHQGKPGVGADGERRVLAVLPLDDLSSEPQEWFAAGLTEELIGHLARLDPQRLGVIARVSSTAFAGSGRPLAEIREVLDVDYVIEGSVRREGDRLRFSVQLVRTSDQSHLWSETYDRPAADALAIQSELAEGVGRTLALRLLRGSREALERASTTETAAYEAFLKAREEWNLFTEDGFRAAITHYRKALELDPDFALAWSGLADAYSLLAAQTPAERDVLFGQARGAALRAIDIDPNLAEGHNSLAFVLLYGDWDLQAARRAFERSLALHPGYALAQHWTAGVYSALGEHDRAIAAARSASRLDPLSPMVRADLGWYYLLADRYEEGVAECRQARELGASPWARACIETGLIALGRWQEALDEVRRHEDLPADLPSDPRLAMQRVQGQRLERGDDAFEGWPLDGAIQHARLGNVDTAIDWLERGLEVCAGWAVFLRVDPRFDPLHGHPRFEALADRVGLPT